MYNLLLSKRQIYKVYVVEDHEAATLHINDTDKLKRVFDSQEAVFLTIKLVDTLEVKDLGINLADKKIYQLIDKANKARYYYNQVKGQHL